jgi:hypothetical protein
MALRVCLVASPSLTLANTGAGRKPSCLATSYTMCYQVPRSADSTGRVVDFVNLTDAVAQDIKIPMASTKYPADSRVKWPVVEFIPPRHADPANVYKKVVIPVMSVDMMNAQGTSEATRAQVPLILAW